jgi:hypothetical protein
MNDTERDLRELFEAKAKDAGGAPPVTDEVLRRGRRRQVGTIAVAAVTALAVAAVAVVSLQALDRADTSVPGGPRGNPAFPATIQNFTLNVPQGWTLVDRWPLGSSMAVSSSGSGSFSCTGTPIEAGNGKNASSSTDCPDQQLQTSEPPAIPLGGLPMLTLSNDDPGLGGSVCTAGGSMPATSATLYIGLDYGATRTTGWESTVQAWPEPLTNVLDGDLPPEEMPCGPGGYAHFQTGGLPYVAWAGFGSDVTDADRQAVVDAFNSMQVSDGGITSPSSEVPSYVLTGGTTAGGSEWAIEVSPSSRNVDMRYSEVGGSGGGGAGDFTVPDVPIEASTGHPVVFGAVTFEADRVEVRPADGSDPVPGTILRLPDSLGAPFDAFVAPNSPDGEVVAIGPEGDLGRTATIAVGPEPAPTVQDVQSDLRNAYVAAKTYYTDGNTFYGFDPQVARSFGTSLRFNEATQATAGEVSIRDVGAHHIVFAEATASGDVLCVAETTAGMTTYGTVDAQRFEECVGGEAAWGQTGSAGSPAAEPASTNTVNLEGFPSPATLSINGPDGGCLSIEFATGSTGSGGAVCRPSSPQTSTFATIIRVEGSNGSGLLVLVGWTGAKAADQVFLEAADGTRTQAPILYTIQAALHRQLFAFPVATSAGTLHVEDVNGVELSPPIRVDSNP